MRFFPYFGSKSNLSKICPGPLYDTIIEPFAGSATYSVRYWDRDIILIDKYDVIIRIWHYLQQVSPKDILGLPEIKPGLDLTKLNLSQAEKDFVGMWLSFSKSKPMVKRVSPIPTVSPKGRILLKSDMPMLSYREKVSKNLYKIKHWKIKQGDYTEAPDIEATWFIDPPYQDENLGKWYKHKRPPELQLRKWCDKRKGQILLWGIEKGRQGSFEFDFANRSNKSKMGTRYKEGFYTNTFDLLWGQPKHSEK